jgi:hypothetical protein
MERPHLAFAYCGLSRDPGDCRTQGFFLLAHPRCRIGDSGQRHDPNTRSTRRNCDKGMLTPKPPSSPATASALHSIYSASRSISSVPGSAEHPHPVASQDFRDVDKRVTVAQQFGAEEWEVRYLIEILDVLE